MSKKKQNMSLVMYHNEDEKIAIVPEKLPGRKRFSLMIQKSNKFVMQQRSIATFHNDKDVEVWNKFMKKFGERMEGLYRVTL